MKTRLIKFLSAMVLILAYATDADAQSDLKTYDIAQVYEAVEMENGSKSIDSYGNVEEVKTVLTPTRFDEGKYSVELTRVDTNFYKIEGTSMYIETRYCYEYAYRDDAILILDSYYGYTKGEVAFLE
ncbi:MAG: hypothetical protein E7115_09255 [Bacteroidales bacterium]|nr:hypothetical protein [Bacteroidales bacterium]MBE6241664.1 hypothetical protein [Bacteroidales bacterium]